MTYADKRTVEELARAVHGREAYASARRTLGNSWTVEIHVDSRGPGRNVVDHTTAMSLRAAYSELAIKLRPTAIGLRDCNCSSRNLPSELQRHAANCPMRGGQ